MTFTPHFHSTYSIRDAIIKIPEAAAKIKASGGTHFSVSDHGSIQGWLALRDACQKEKLTPVYSCELYVSDHILELKKVVEIRAGLSNKEKADATIQAFENLLKPAMEPERYQYLFKDAGDDNSTISKTVLGRASFGYQHLVAVAINEEGKQNLIKLCNEGWAGGYYFKPQVTTEQCLRYSTGIAFTTACMGGPIAKRFEYGTEETVKNWLKKWESIKDRFFIEVQPLDLLQQRIYNIRAIQIAKQMGFPLIISQDCHHLEEEEWQAHRILMLSQNNRTIDELEDIYSLSGKEVTFSELKKHLGTETTWEAQKKINTDKIPLIRHAGHHYGDVKLHWRTDDAVRKQVEKTNPELLAVLDECFASCKNLQDMVKPQPWSNTYRLAKHENSREKLLKICAEKLQAMNLWPTEANPDKTYFDWLKKENKVITACNFWDYIWTLYIWTKKVQEEGIPIGYARGSGGGCLVMYLLGIIRVDPVANGLYFERFLNPARLGLDPKTLQKVKEASSCPDVDLDFSSINRDRVITIAEELFGKANVIPVGTLTESGLRTALADVCRVLKITQAEFMPASKELPKDATGDIDFDRAMEIPGFADFVNKHDKIKQFLPSLIGTFRSIGQHASGVCITDVPIVEATPIVRAGTKDGGNIVTGFGESGAERALESVGFIKFDALATDTVDHVSLCATTLHEIHLSDPNNKPWIKEGEKFLYPEQIPSYTPNDPEVMRAVFHTGNTDGIFQFEESVGKDMARIIKPDTIGEIADISTMIRPGCLQAPCHYYVMQEGSPAGKDGNGLHYEYASRKFEGAINPPPVLPQCVLDVLKPTHYCCIYQEQMMFLIQEITGGKMSLGEGDIYRRNIEQAGKGKEDAKKKVAEMEEEMKRLSSFPPEIVDKVTTIIKGGASYAFNKSHSVSYSMFSYAQAWFKHYYPHIFVASHVTLLSAKNKLDKLHKIVNNSRSLGIAIRSPHVGHSGMRATWSQDGKTVYLPLTVLKGLKEETALAVQEIGKGCTNLDDFIVKAIMHPKIKKNHIISLAKTGGLDFGQDRLLTIATAVYVTERTTTKSKESVIREYLNECKAFKISGTYGGDRASADEMECFGGFINECPLDKYVSMFENAGVQRLGSIEPAEGEEFLCYFMVNTIVKKVHKSGNSAGKEWYKLICWDGVQVCDLSVWAYDLEGNNEGMMGYRSFLAANKVYCALVSSDGQRPATLAHRSKHAPRETLWLKG